MIETILLGIIAGASLYACGKMEVINDISHEIRDLLLAMGKDK